MRCAHALFDLNGTLFDPSPMAEPLPEGVDREAFAEAVIGDAVLLGMVETITGSFSNFAELLRSAAAYRLNRIGAPEALEAAMEGVARMRPFPDAAVAIATLRRSGVGVGVLTNSSAETARSLLEASGLDLDPVVGSDDVGAFKPDPRLYRKGVEATGRDPNEVVLVTAHWWDGLGALRAGLQAAWISRKERHRLEFGPAPDFDGADLAEVAERIALVRRIQR